MKKVKVIILDDSLFMREALQQELERDVNIKVVAKAVNAYDARDKIVEHLPDVLIADVNLGEMSGVDFVRRLLPQYYLPVIMISSDRAFKVVSEQVHAVDFVPKPEAGDAGEMGRFYRRILMRIKAIVNREEVGPDAFLEMRGVVAIGASTGGAQAVEKLLGAFPSVMPPIVVAQHMPEGFTSAFAHRLNDHVRLSVKEAGEGDLLVPGQAYVVPGGKHMVTARRGGRLYLQAVAETEVKPCPNIDLLFESVAECGAKESIGVLLTGMGRDGAAGLLRMRQAGNRTIGQDKHSSVVYGMPKAAYEMGAVMYQLGLDRIADKIMTLLTSR